MARRAEPTPVTPGLLRAWPLPRPGEDKAARGSVLVVGGSRRTPGAVMLSAEAALRAGAGKLQVVTVDSVATEVAVALPEALVVGAPETSDGEIRPTAEAVVVELADGADAVLVGPGSMQPEVVTDLLVRLLPHLTGKVVLDALALSYVARSPDGLAALPAQYLLTPNEHELAMAFGKPRLTEDPGIATARLADRTGAVVSSGGEVTWTGSGDRLWRDDAGCPGLGVSGSGDVKSGVIAGLWARGCDADQAAVWGAHLHARAGERLASAVGPVGYLARQIADEIPATMAELSP